MALSFSTTTKGGQCSVHMDMVCTSLLAWPKIENVEKAASSTICLRYFFIIYFIIFNMGQPGQIKDSRNTSNKSAAKNFIENYDI